MRAYELRALRRGVTQEELRQEAGLLIGTLTDIESGAVGIDQETYDDLLAAVERVRARKSERQEVMV